MTAQAWSAIDKAEYVVCTEVPGGAAMRLMLSAIEALNNGNASVIIKETLKWKIVIEKLVNELEPPELKMRIINERAF